MGFSRPEFASRSFASASLRNASAGIVFCAGLEAQKMRTATYALHLLANFSSGFLVSAAHFALLLFPTLAVKGEGERRSHG